MSTNNVNIVNTNNWYQKMNTNGNQNVTNMVLSGTNPSTQMTLINSANDVHYLYSNYPISSVNGFTMSFQFYISGTASNLTRLNAFFGTLDYNVGTNLNGQGGVQVLINPGGYTYNGEGNGHQLQIISSVTSETWPIVSNNTTVTAGAWQTVSITFNPFGTTGNWVVSYNGTTVMTYNYSSNIYGNPIGQNSTWGIGATNGETPATVFIRNVDLSVKHSMPLSVLKNTYSFYPEECFINKLSTHSQTNAAAAFGLRLLKADYLGPVINIRRGSDNATLDFYADSKGNLGTTLYGTGRSLLDWLAGSIGYVTRWYDQTGNGRDVIQSTTSAQPKIGAPLLDKLSSAGKSAARGIYALYDANSTYTGATIRLRRSADNFTSDFYADVYGNLTDSTGTSFTSWIGSSTAYVDTWYDQSGSGNHATQSTTANQPVYNGTLKLIDSLNSSSLFLNMPSGTVPTGTLDAPYSFVFKHGSYNNVNGAFIGSGIWSNSQSNVVRLFSGQPNGYNNYWFNNDLLFGTNNSPNGNTVAITYNGTVHRAYINDIMSIQNSNHTGGTTAAAQQTLFRSPGGEYLNGQMYSVFIFGSALSDSDRFACTGNPIEMNIKYDGSQCLNGGTTNWPLTNGLKNYTYIFNGRIDGYNNDQCIIQMGPWNSNNTGSALYLRSNSYGFAGYNNDALNIVAYTQFVNRKCVMMCNHNLNTDNIVINDNGTIYTGTTSSPSALNLTNAYFTIGSVVNNPSSGEAFTGNLNEIIIFKSTLTTKESQLYFIPDQITRKLYRSQPVIHIKDVRKDVTTMPGAPTVTMDTSMLQNMSVGGYVTNWFDYTVVNNPILNAASSINSSSNTAIVIPPYVSLNNSGLLSNSASGKYISCGTRTFNISTNGGFTAIWYGAFTGTPGANERIFDFGSGIDSNNLIVMRNGTSTDIYLILLNGSTQYPLIASSAIIQDEWAVWVFRYNTTGNVMEIIKNGLIIASGTTGATLTNRTLTNTWIGRSNWVDTDNFSNINMVGFIAYDKFIAATELTAISNQLVYCTNPGAPLYLPEYNNKVVLYGQVISQGFKNGPAMRFPGTINSYIDIQDVPNWPMSFCFWMYNTSTLDTSPAALCSNDGTSNVGVGFGIQMDIWGNGTELTPYISTNGSGYTAMTTSTISINTWHHIAFVVTPTTVAYYVNGSLIQSTSAVIYNTNRLVLGKSGDNYRPLNGYLQDVRIYDYALRADEVGYLSKSTYDYNEERALLNYNTPANYLVNMSNWYSKMNIYKTGSYTIISGISDPNVQYQLTSLVANSSNTLFNSTKIQNYNSFTCSFDIYIGNSTDHGFYFYCGATSSTTVPTGTVGTSVNSSYYIYFQVTGTKGIYLFNHQGHQLAYSPEANWTAIGTGPASYVPITIIYNRSEKNTWTINVSSVDVIKYNDPNNSNWVSNIAGDFWGIGARTTTSGMYCYIRRVELTYTPFINSVSTTVNAQNNTKFPPGAMTAASTTFIGSSILDGVYTATASNSNGSGINPYSAFDNNTSTYWGELTSYNKSSTATYNGGISTVVTNLTTGTSTSYTGEWLQIQVPNAVTLNSFSLMGRQDETLYLWRTPNTFYIAGSNNNSTWELLHSTSGAQFTSAMQYFTCNAGNTNKYRYFRLIINSIGNSGNLSDDGGPAIDITAWDLYTQMNTVNASIVSVPPYSMTADTTTFAGNSLYDGTYIVTANNTHTHPTIGPIYAIFNDTYGSPGNVSTTGNNYNSSTGVYTGAASTTVSGVTQSGDWIQIQIPNPIVLYSFSLNFWWDSQAYWAKSFLIAASNDGTTWTNIYDTTNANFVYSTAQTFVVTGSPNAYRYFRLIVRATSGVQICDWWILDQWKLYTNQSNFNLTKFPPAPLTADSPVTFTTVNTKNWYNIMNIGTTSWYTPVLSESDPFKQLQLTPGSASVGTYCNISGQPVMNYDSFTFTFQLFCANTNNGDWLRLFFGGGGYYVTFSFEIYYYAGIILSTNSVGNAVSSATNWYNSTWNDIRIVYNRSATNTWTLFFNETQVIQYSDPNWYNNPGSTWGFDTFNGAAHFVSYIRQLEMTISPQSPQGNSILSGSYTASSSTVYNNNADLQPSYAFNDSLKNTSDGTQWHSGLNYNTSNGIYAGAITTTVSGISYAGDWLQLQTPNPLQLTSFSIYPRQDGSLFSLRSPRNFVMAGSNDNSTWYLLHTATGVGDWTASDKYFVCNEPNVASKYTYFRLITMAIGNPGSFSGNSNCVNIYNLNLYTSITLNNSITPATPKGLLDGLTWKYFDGDSGNNVSHYTTNTYRNIGRCTDTTNINTLTSGQYPVNNGDYYSMEIFGYFRATVSGTYTFYLATDDGSYLWIGNNALVGYTTSNANIQHPSYNDFNPISCTVTLLAGTYYPIRIHWTEGGGGDNLQFSFTPPGGIQTYNGQGFFFSGTGLDSAFPQESAKIIKDLTSTNKDGIYYILVNGISTPIHCLMNDCYDGGGWMMLMKSTTGTAFKYDSSYWSTKNTLNAADTTRNDADAKYNTFNYSPVKDVLAIFPDISSTSYTNPYGKNGGSIFVNDGWTWLLNNWNETTRTTPFTGFSTTRLPHQNTLNSVQTYGINNPFRYNGFGTWCSNQTGAYKHGFNIIGESGNSSNPGPYIRWGFLFNNEGDFQSCDDFCGIGVGGYGNIGAGDSGGGINRTMRFELYGR